MKADDSADVVLVAGAGGGVGAVLSKTFAANGYHVLANGRTPDRAAEVVSELAAACPDGRFTPVAGDVTDQDSVAKMFEAIGSEVGRLNAFVDCSQPGSGRSVRDRPITRARFADLDPATFEARVVNGLVPIFTMCHHALPLLKAAGGGSIVTFGTDAGRVALPGQTMTGSLRAALYMFTRTLAMEVSGDHIRVNAISPTYIRDTPIFDRVMAGGPDSRAATATKRAKLGLPSPKELAQLAVFLCSDAAAQLTGQVISVNGGLSAV
jgi:3-oxoacyl-[acyl-carrier protein] reductase